MQALFSNKKILIGVVVVIVAFVAYGMFFVAGSKSTTTAVSRTTVSSNASQNSALNGGAEGPGQEFVAQLLAIQSISFKLSFFADPVFQHLIVSDNELTPQPQGRDNPFAPFETLGRAAGNGAANDLGITPDSSAPASSSTAKVKATTKVKTTR